MISFWNVPDMSVQPMPTLPKGQDNSARVRELEQDVARLRLLNQALWELLQQRLNLTDADLERKTAEVDLRDGMQDGKISTTALTCPNCKRVSSSKHWKCLYCGLEFQKPVMG